MAKIIKMSAEHLKERLIEGDVLRNPFGLGPETEMTIRIKKASPEEAEQIALMVKRLTDEIIDAIGEKPFNIDLAETSARCRRFLEQELYAVYRAINSESDEPLGFIALCESHALYAEGAFGIIQELYVDPAHRSKGIGGKLVKTAMDHARKQGWKRLEVCTPPLPQFAGTVQFYERQRFEVTGGRKMKVLL